MPIHLGMRKLAFCLVVVLLGAGVLTAAPAFAAYGAIVQLPASAFYSPYGGPATVTFTFDPGDASAIFTVRIRRPGPRHDQGEGRPGGSRHPDVPARRGLLVGRPLRGIPNRLRGRRQAPGRGTGHHERDVHAVAEVGLRALGGAVAVLSAGPGRLQGPLHDRLLAGRGLRRHGRPRLPGRRLRSMLRLGDPDRGPRPARRGRAHVDLGRDGGRRHGRSEGHLLRARRGDRHGRGIDALPSAEGGDHEGSDPARRPRRRRTGAPSRVSPTSKIRGAGAIAWRRATPPPTKSRSCAPTRRSRSTGDGACDRGNGWSRCRSRSTAAITGATGPSATRPHGRSSACTRRRPRRAT